MKKIIGLLSIIVVLMSSCKSDLSVEEKQNYTTKGKQIAQETFKTLGGNLMKKMKEGGVKTAIPYCNANASELTQNIAKTHNVTIKRTSLKLRNTANKPSKEEQIILEKYAKSITQNEELKPIVTRENDGKVHFYAPIKLKGKCVVCHGDISENTNNVVKSLYPNDKATGFKKGDLRGIWSITFEK